MPESNSLLGIHDQRTDGCALMKIQVEIGGQRFAADSREARSIAILLDFDGPQPNHFGVGRATSSAVEAGSFIGDTARGGSCNVDQLTMIPHCNGTHTESISHIVDQRVPVGELATEGWFLARLVSVTPVPARETGESYRPELDHHDLLVTAAALEKASGAGGLKNCDALVVRTLPNDPAKKSRQYGNPDHPPFFTIEAMQWVVDQKIRHLLVDLPSIDRMYDEGLLTNHHLFWNVPEGTHQLTNVAYRDRTITEMIFAGDELDDGHYLLSLQLAALASDASPSRPILYRIE
jgi:kynurenine formamidase